MTNSVVSRLGQVNTAGADDALFLKQFGGEILTEFETATVFKSRHYTRQIRNGKTAQFPLIGTVTSSMHTPGNFIDGQQVKHAENTISIDGLLVAPIFVASIDEMMNHYDVRGPYSTEMGRELAKQYDVAVARMGLLAARSSNTLTGRAGGSVISATTMSTDSAKIITAMFGAAQTFDEKNVGGEDRNCFVKPAQYYLLTQNTTLLNSYFKGNANISAGTVDTAAGLTLVKTNNLPSTVVSTGVAKYQGDFTKTVALVMNKWAVGSLHLQDIALESEYEIRRQGTFMVAKMAVGHDKLRVDCAIELANV